MKKRLFSLKIVIKIILTLICFSTGSPWLVFGQEWKPIGPQGTFVEDIAIAANAPNILYVYSPQAVFRSMDYGKTWAEIADESDFEGHPLGAVVSLSIDPEDADTIYLGAFAALWESVDGGQSWHVVIDTLGFTFGHVNFNPENSKTRFVPALDADSEDSIAGGGLFRSLDNGASWDLLNTPFSGRTVVDFEISPIDTLQFYATISTADSSFIYNSVDFGKTWTAVVHEKNYRMRLLAISADSPDVLYATAEEVGTAKNKILISSDGGNTWQTLQSNLPPSRIHSLAIHPHDGNRLFAAIGAGYVDKNASFQKAFGLYRSRNGGLFWERLDLALDDSLFLDIEIDPVHPDTVYTAAALFGAYASENGGTSWEERNGGDLHKIGGEFNVNHNNVNEINLITSNEIIRTGDGGKNWRKVFAFDKAQLDFSITNSPSEPNVLYATAQRIGPLLFMKSEDGGLSWSSQTDSILSGTNIRLYVGSQNSDLLYASSWEGIFKSLDGGQTWEQKRSGVTTGLVNSLAFNPSNLNTIYAGTFDGLFKSTNGGEDWVRVGTDNSQVQEVAVSPFDTTLIFSSTNYRLSEFGRLRKSNDSGKSWSDIFVPNNEEVFTFLLDNTTPGGIWIVTFSGSIEFTTNIFYSANNGESWTAFDNGLPFRRVSQLSFISEIESNLFVMTEKGLFTLDIVTKVEDREEIIPKTIKLFQNFPNPLNPETRIRYRLTEPAFVQLKIFNLTGQEVRTLESEQKSAGDHSILWDGRDNGLRPVSSGVYIYTITVTSATGQQLKRSRKLVLLR